MVNLSLKTIRNKDEKRSRVENEHRVKYKKVRLFVSNDLINF